MEEPHEIGDWRKISVLGSGGFGIVSLWANKVTKDSIAIKKCRWGLPDSLSPNQRQRWTKEVEMLKNSIRHENIASFKDIPKELNAVLMKYNPSKLPILSMEYCTQGNLRYYMSKRDHTCGLPEMEVRYVLKDMSAAISYLHRLNITHRDIKPENIVLQRYDDRPNKIIFKLIDLGYAKELGSETASFVGTMLYLAPEIFKQTNYNKNVDYWSFGVVVFEVVCGVHPFLPKVEPFQRFEHLQKKSPDHICLFTSRSGEVNYSQEILPENYISLPLKNHLERWLKVMLRFDPAQRGVTGSGKDVFQELNEILQKKIVVVFSVYNYRYYHYEVDASTTLASLQGWIEQECQIPIGEQLLITENMFYDDAADRKVLDCLDETNLLESHLILFKKEEFVQTPEHMLPPVVKNLMANSSKEYVWDKLHIQIAKCVHYIKGETDLMVSLEKATMTLFHYIKHLLKKEAAHFENVQMHAKRILVQIEAYKGINIEMKEFGGINGISENCKKYKQYLWQSRELVENVNAVMYRHSKLQSKEVILDEIFATLEGYAAQRIPDEINTEAFSCMIISNQSAQISPKNIVQALSKCIKRRYKLSTELFFKDYIAYSTKIFREINRLFKWMTALQLQMEKIFAELMVIQATILKDMITCGVKLSPSRKDEIVEVNVDDLINDNNKLRYSVQDVMSEILLNHKTYSISLNEEMETQV